MTERGGAIPRLFFCPNDYKGMEHIATILTSSNLIPLAVIAVTLILLAAFLSRKGYFSFHGKGLSVGRDEIERKIMRQQSQYLTTAADATIRDLPPEIQKDYYRCKYTISKFKDIFEEAIMYNHITDDEEYISLKQEIALNLILKITEDDFFKTEGFKKYLDALVEKIIKRFVKIRKTYS